MKLYVIPGSPVPLARPRFSHSSYQRVYDSQKHLKNAAAIHITNQHGDLPLLEGALHLDCVFYMPMPKGISQRKHATMKGSHHTIRPDLSNILKFLEDVAQGIIFSDDAIISSIDTKKIYDDNPRTEFSFKIISA